MAPQTALVAMIMALSWTQAFAQGGDPNDSTVWGAGWTSCGKLVTFDNARDATSLGIVVTWSQGYLSANNAFLASQNLRHLRFVDPDSIQAYLVKYCRENPLKRAYDGVQTLSMELRP